MDRNLHIKLRYYFTIFEKKKENFTLETLLI